MSPHPLVGHVYPEVERTYSPKDLALYALGVGAGDARHAPRFIDDSRPDFMGLPTFPLVLPYPPVLDMGIPLEHDLGAVLHGEQFLKLHGPVPLRGTARTRCEVVRARDKGKAAIFDVEAAIEVDGVRVATTIFSTFVAGAGGWGGERGSVAETALPRRDPDLRLEHVLWRHQAALYRLSGDVNPLHIDQAAAERVGFDRPILHGLCTLGVAVQLVVDSALSDGAESMVSEVFARFVGHVYPGETLVVEGWRTSDRVLRARVRVAERDVVVVEPLTITLQGLSPEGA